MKKTIKNILIDIELLFKYSFYYPITNFFKKVKFAFHRMFFGYSNEDTYDFTFWFSNIGSKIIKRMAEITIARPMNSDLDKLKELFPEIDFFNKKIPENLTTEKEINSFISDQEHNDWILILNALSDLMKNSHRETCLFKNKEDPKNSKTDRLGFKEYVKTPEFVSWSKREDEIEKLVEESQKRLFKILPIIFNNLWR